MQKVKKVLVISVCIMIIAIIGFIIAIPISNNLAAKETAQELADIPLPEHTEYIEKVYLAGKLVGNGNGMQYFGAILIKSELSLTQLTEYYGTYASNNQEYIVKKQTDKNISIIEHETLLFKSNIESDNYYIVYSWGSNNSLFCEFDLRGY